MKKKFFEYYKPSEKDFEGLWKKCLFIFDTSVLINLYEFSPKVRDEYLEVLKKNSDRIWIPHQVAKEYQWRRPSIIREQKAIHQQLRNEFLKTRDSIIENIEKSIQYHPFFDKTQLEDEVKKIFSNLIAYLRKCEEGYPDLIKKDIIGEKIDILFDGKVGDECTDDELQKIFTSGAKRYIQKIPPGFADQGAKDNFKQYGDLILWHQIIRHSISSKMPVIFVTNDQKNDWWFIHFQGTEKEILGPRPELIKEFFEKTKNSFYMYNPSDFLEASRKYLKQKVSDVAIKEVQNVSKKPETGYGRDSSGNYFYKNYIDNCIELRPRDTMADLLRNARYEPITSGSIFVRSTDNPTELRPGETMVDLLRNARYEPITSGSIFVRSTDNPTELRPGERIFEFARDASSGSLINVNRENLFPNKDVYSSPIIPQFDENFGTRKPPTRKKT
jgi:hypothetical protein